MTNSQTPPTSSPPEHPDQFTQAVRKTLESLDDAAWIREKSPLRTLLYHAQNAEQKPLGTLPSTGQALLDEQLQAIWTEWCNVEHSLLQSLLTQTMLALSADQDQDTSAILLLTYFQLPKPKQRDVVRALAMSRATYYRKLEKAVALFADKLLTLVHPALRLEWPTPTPLVGREQLLATAESQLQAGRMVYFVGGSGLGKSSVAAHLAHRWGRDRALWYTFRPAVADQAEQFIYALAFFFHQQGVSQLWLHLTLNPQEMTVEKAMAFIRYSLEALRATPPLLCLDDVDLLLPARTEERSGDQAVGALIEELAQVAQQQAIPLLLIGQKLLLQPDPVCCHLFQGLDHAEINALLAQEDVALTPAVSHRLQQESQGNPLLIRSFLIWQRLANEQVDPFAQLTAPMSFDWVWARLRGHLTAREEQLLLELSVYPGVAARSLWYNREKELTQLIELQLLIVHEGTGIALHPTIRRAIYAALTAEQKPALHLDAATAAAQGGEFTAAAHHYLHGGAPELAIWTWYTHREREINQGQARAALALFSTINRATLVQPADRKALALLFALLHDLTGESDAGLRALDEVAWPPEQPTTALAQELRGRLLKHRGQIEQAVEHYRQSIELTEQLRSVHNISLRTTIGRYQLAYFSDLDQARAEALQAQYDLEILQGEIESACGNYQAAHHHYQAASTLAAKLDSPYALAKVHEGLGILHAFHVELNEAIAHLQQAGEHYRAYGNLICAVGVTNTNIAYAHLLARKYEQAIAPAEAAVEFFTKLDYPYWLALNAANLAEAHCYLGDLERAEAYAERCLRHEEVSVRPYAFYVLGQIQRQRGEFESAVEQCRQAVAAAQENQDPWALGPAWRALGESYRDWGNVDAARAAFQELRATYQRLGVRREIAWSDELLATL